MSTERPKIHCNSRHIPKNMLYNKCNENTQKQLKTLHLWERSGMGLVMVNLEDTATHVVATSIPVLNLRKIRCAFFELPELLIGLLYPLKKWVDIQ